MRAKTFVLTSALVFFSLAVVASASHAPTNLVIVKHSARTVTVGWTAVPDVTGYGLFVDGVRVATAGAAATQAKFGTPQWRRYVLGVSALKTGGATSTITVDPRWVAVSVSIPPEPGPTYACSDGQDNDGDSKIDLVDPGCSSATDNDETDVPQPPTGSVTLTQVDGGTSYYTQFTNPLSNTVIPIGVWFESVIDQGNIDLDKDVGLNLYVVLTANSDLSLVRNNGMHSIIQSSERTRFTGVGTETAGWELHDEIDMQCGPPCDGYGQLDQILAGLPNDGRARFNNYGKGIMFWQSDADASKFVNGTHGPNSFQQLISDDVYWFTDPGGACSAGEGGNLLKNGQALTQAECRRASNYGAVVEKMRRLDAMDGLRMPIWNFVEVGHPFTESDAPTITGPQIRAAVWHSFIAGARGILYFNHNFGGSCISQHVLRDSCGAAVRPTVKAVNTQIQSLASVLNSPTVTSGFTANASVKAMAKWNGSNFYVFAGSANNASSTGSFSIPCVGNATATVIGENRTLSVSSGSFSDSFTDGNTVHIYRIDGGSRCGL